MTRLLIVDNHDSFTYNIVEDCRHLGVEPLVIRNDDPAGLPLEDVGAIIISPGPGRADHPADTGLSAEALRSGLPVLGVCLGMQLMAVAAGGTLRTHPPHHGVLSSVEHDGSPLFDTIPSPMSVTRYHSWVVERPGEDMEVLARSEDGVIQALRHRRRPWWGVQFHPESISTPDGRTLLRNFLRLAGWPHVRAQRLPAREGWTAEALFCSLFAEREVAIWLDDSTGTGWSILADDGGPDARLLRLRGAPGEGGELDRELRAPWAGRRLLAEPDPDRLPFRFRPGWVGWLGYEAETGGEFLFVDRAILVGPGENPDIYAISLHEDEEWFADLRRHLAGPAPAAPGPARAPEPEPLRLRAREGREQYLAKIAAVQEAIRAGETYEACLTTQLRGRGEVGVEHYLRLRAHNPAPYGAYLRFGETQVLSTSPELFLRCARGELMSRPIKGTRPRSADPAELAAHPKDRAENRMITDLVRNDLARVCAPGSVRVPELFGVESFATVHQLVSTVVGQCRPGVDVVDALAAAFPGGSMTGAPKERTCEILAELEGEPRGVYSGCLGWLSGEGEAELAMTIRTLVANGRELSYGVGGAILDASDPEAEWEEVRTKCQALAPIARLDL
ncbi:chorismate-binding protein [Corynebacterium uropygiale]|uniref:aminodeoxychorismate synthase n=1 Tax=Corynebacterium uropygiale TaxID=1775911 RepID=A0A9X1QPT0_9CORY|nr:chorismate-binding protein [Corynebacterium uropygiale]